MQVIGKLKKGGGKRDTYLCEMVTHVIADDVTNHEYQEARELFELPCVMVSVAMGPFMISTFTPQQGWVGISINMNKPDEHVL